MNLDDYIAAHSSFADPLLAWVERETHYHTVHPRMLSGRPTGDFLSFLSCLLRPRLVLEVGTFTGYSALCLSKGIVHGGRLDTIEINDELEESLRDTFARAGRPVRLLMGDAMDILPGLRDTYDLIYLDADKRQYLSYYRMVKPLMHSASLLLADNVLWGGKVADPSAHRDAQTQGILAFNDFVQADAEVQNVLLPLADGLMLVRLR